jgi:hypothetical protein
MTGAAFFLAAIVSAEPAAADPAVFATPIAPAEAPAPTGRFKTALQHVRAALATTPPTANLRVDYVPVVRPPATTLPRAADSASARRAVEARKERRG